jgi:broad-specificity NMP kinase
MERKGRTFALLIKQSNDSPRNTLRSIGRNNTYPINDILHTALIDWLNEYDVIVILRLDKIELECRAYIRMLQCQKQFVENVTRGWIDIESAVAA